MLDALREVPGARPAAVIAAELGVAHDHGAGSPAFLPVLVVEKPQVDSRLGRLLVHVIPVGFPEDALPRVLVGIEQAVDVLLAQALRVPSTRRLARRRC